ncbi:hypothetical protein EIN_281200 [Entamoeba invadens IP1]|uniref:Uncharacterized protein n=1 Tax=Entamoeba invadens IP1 TaxID=370355 RepID=A0A0A1U2I7_ENTIV|nr:hypothetical protein EIN_281200 [Entamoeba invadens IP1]ELP85759.1 hypothetical protein EIN_281200 [Entamoeba invadens IP1]|eukprot:XP_004185105.1 hypothetical protein EIN_281200 [Entamoeba invadens IP1]
MKSIPISIVFWCAFKLQNNKIRGMNTLMFMIIYYLLPIVLSRPVRQPILGDQQKLSSQRNFVFHTPKSSTGTEKGILNYAVEMTDNVHNLDGSMFIDSIDCSKENMLKIVTTSKTIENWKEDDLISGSSMWGCENLNRRVKSLDLQYEENGYFGYIMKTSNADIKEYFTKARVRYSSGDDDEEVQIHPPVEHHNTTQNPGNNQLIQSTWSDSQENEFKFLKGTRKSEDYIEEAEPLIGNVFYRGDKITVKFKTFAKCQNTDLSIRWKIKKHISLKQDEAIMFFTSTVSKEHNDGSVIAEEMVLDSTELAEYAYISMSVTCMGTEYKYYLSKYFSYNVIPEIIVTSPSVGKAYQLQDTITFEWEYTNEMIQKYPTITLIVFECGKVSCNKVTSKKYLNEEVQTKLKQFTWQIDKNIVKDTDLVLQIDYNCNFAFSSWCEYAISPMFQVLSPTSSADQVTITDPEVGNLYQSGEQLCVHWTYEENMEDELVIIELKKDVFGLDPTYYQGYTNLHSKVGCFEIPPVSGSSDFYTQMRFKCGLFFCKLAVGNYITINQERKIRFEHGSAKSPYKSIDITFGVDKPISDKFYISVKQKYPNFLVVQPPIVLQTFYGPDYVPGQRYNTTLVFKKESPFKLFVSIQYDCLIGKFMCKTERSRYFSIETTSSGGWNDPNDPSGFRKKIPLFDLSCRNVAKSTNPIGVALKKLCSQSTQYIALDAGIKTTCENCYAIAKFKLKNFEFDLSFAGVSRMSADIVMDTTLSFNTVNQFNIKLRSSQQIPIFDLKELGIPSFQLQIGSYLLSIGPILSANYVYNFDFSIFAKLLTKYTVNYQFKLNYNNFAKNPLIYEIVKKETKGEIGYEGGAALNVDFGLKLQVGVGIGVGSLNLDVYTWANNTLTMKYPPFQPSADYLVEGRKVPHYLNYDLDFTMNVIPWYKFPWAGSKRRDYTFVTYEYNLLRKGFLEAGTQSKERIVVISVENDYFTKNVELAQLHSFDEINSLLHDFSLNSTIVFPEDKKLVSFSKEEQTPYSKVEILISDVKIQDELLYKLKKYILFGEVPSGVTLSEEYTFLNILSKSTLKTNKIDGCKMTDLKDEKCRECNEGYVMKDWKCFPFNTIE